MAKRKAPNGSGTIRKRADGRYEGRVPIGVNPATGRTTYKYVYDLDENECQKKRRALAVAIDQGTYAETSKMKLSRWLDMWLDLYTSNIRPGTLRSYSNNVHNHIIPALGGTKLCDLKPPMIQKFIRDLERAEKPLSNKTIHNIHGTLHKALGEAVRGECIQKNPADNTILPKVEKPKIEPLAGNEIDLFMQAIQGNPSEDVFFVGLWTGMRLSELLGLQWSCVDFDKGTIRVDKQLSWKRKEVDGRDLTKTKNGKARTVTPPKGVMDRLKRIRTNQKEAKLRAKGLWNNELNLVFTDELGGCLPHTTVEHRFKKVCEKLGLDRHFHDLRHTFATEGIRLGIPVKTVSEELGHYSSSFTMDVYGHATTQMQQEAAEKLQASLDARIGNG